MNGLVASQTGWSRIWRIGAASVSGGLLASAFPPVSGGEAAWLALVPLLILARFTSPLRCFKWGFLFGMVFWLTSLFWLLAIGRTGAHWSMAVLAWVSLSACCALFSGAFLVVTGALMARMYREDSAPDQPPGRIGIVRQMLKNIGLVCTIPLVWVGFEYVRSNVFTGFPWNQLGVSQYRNLAVIQLAEWGGVYAVSALVVVMNTAIAMMGLRLGNVYRRRQRTRFQAELAFGFLVCVLCWVNGVKAVRAYTPRSVPHKGLRIAIVQPNVEQRKKWRPEDARTVYAALEEGTELALALRDGLDLIVWPETAVPGPLMSDPETAVFVRGLAREGVPILLGSMEILPGTAGATDWREAGARFYNSSYLVDTNGIALQRYRKRHLVPFGEYLPFDRTVRQIAALAPLGFSCTPGTASTVFRITSARSAGLDEGAREECPFSVLICFEDTVPSLARKSVVNGARLLIVQTNDAWFDPSSASLQHLAHCVFRCVENRVGAVRCANTGVSCFVSRTGVIEGVETLRKENWGRRVSACRISHVEVPEDDMLLTFYSRYGDLPFALPCGVLSLLGFVLVVVTERRNNAT